jgi:hypothetical protein
MPSIASRPLGLSCKLSIGHNEYESYSSNMGTQIFDSDNSEILLNLTRMEILYGVNGEKIGDYDFHGSHTPGGRGYNFVLRTQGWRGVTRNFTGYVATPIPGGRTFNVYHRLVLAKELVRLIFHGGLPKEHLNALKELVCL